MPDFAYYKKFTMLVRPSMLGYIKKLISTAHIWGATLIYSTWNGYKENEDMSKFLSEMQALGVNLECIDGLILQKGGGYVMLFGKENY